ncbi:MAG: NAD(P)/FAD-dependent oxidoreductase [Bdellovibrionales bacterium]|nr:NAD(P)/FAD-dependent oxidoreductase [Bdellovibrionales bacterium]
MGRIVILGGGVSGHTAASFCRKWTGKQHEVVVITPNSKWNWIPSNIWVGVGRMTTEQVTFELAPIYKKQGIGYIQAKAVSLNPEGNDQGGKPFVTYEFTSPDKAGQIGTLEYDYLINATGPKLNFEATEGLGPDHGHSVSVCTPQHAVHASEELSKVIEKMKAGQRQKILIGTGHSASTCQGAAFEYIFNVEHELRVAGVREMADLTWISNEYYLGDFGIAGLHLRKGGYVTSSKIFAESLFAERGVRWILRAGVYKLEPGKVHYETLDGEKLTEDFDFAMLIPSFSGVGLKAFAKDGSDITDTIFAPNGFLKVDGDYTKKPFEEWKASDWPKTYQNPIYKNLFAVGIAFAPPHAISKPMQSKNGTVISPAPPRTGMPSAMIGKAVARTVTNMLNGKIDQPSGGHSMAEMGAACVASTGAGILSGSAVAMTVFPIVPDYQKYPGVGRSLNYTFGEVGLAGHWIKHILHYLFLYKAKFKPGWFFIPE